MHQLQVEFRRYQDRPFFISLAILCSIFLFALFGYIGVKVIHRIGDKSAQIRQTSAEFFQTITGIQDSSDPHPLSVLQSKNATGPLRVSTENPGYFSDGSGKIILLVGSHTWSNFIDSGDTNPPPVFDFSKYLDFLVANNHNFFRLWRAENVKGGEQSEDYWFNPTPYQRVGTGIALDGKPKFDLTQFNQAYFDRMRSRIIEAGDQGIYVSIMLFDGWSAQSKFSTHVPWIGHPFNKDNNINGINGDPNGNGSGEETHTLQLDNVIALQEAYVRKVIDNVNDLDNVLYEISNESPGNSQAWQYHMINYIKDYEASKPKQHPVGMTVEWPDGNNADLFNSPADWISPNGDVNRPMVGDGSKVVLNDTDHLCGVCGDRTWVWKSVTSGLNPIFMDPYNGVDKGRGSFPGYKPDNPNDVSIRKNLGYALTYANRMNLAKMTPRPELCSTGYCLANPAASGAEYLIYLPNGGSATVNLSATQGKLFVEWFNPDKGTTTDGREIQGGEQVSFTAPFGGDAVLYLFQEKFPRAINRIFIPVVVYPVKFQ